MAVCSSHAECGMRERLLGWVKPTICEEGGQGWPQRRMEQVGQRRHLGCCRQVCRATGSNLKTTTQIQHIIKETSMLHASFSPHAKLVQSASLLFIVEDLRLQST